MSQTSVTITGLRELERSLLAMKNAAAGNALRNATNRAGRVLRDEMKRVVPVRTGRLRASIRTFQRRSGVKTGAVSSTGVKGRNAWLARLVEYGTKPHEILTTTGLTIGGGRIVKRVWHPGASPRPFIRPAVDLKWREASHVFGVELAREIVKAAKNPAAWRAGIAPDGLRDE